MKLFNYAILMAALVVSILFTLSADAYAQNSADGNLTVDGDKTVIKHAYADVYDGDITIVLVDNEVPKEMVPDGIYTLGEQGKIKGIVFVVSEETKELMKGGLYNLMNAVHSYPKWNHLGSVGNGVLTIEKSDDNMLTGKIKTPSENDINGHKFTYDISFSVSLKKESLELTMTGKTDAPSKAFGAWGKALFAGDIDEYKKHTSKEILEMMPDDPSELKEGMEFQQLVFPTNIDIVSSNIEGDKAVLKVNGTRGPEVSKGTVTMLKENGTWKVNKQSWKSGTN